MKIFGKEIIYKQKIASLFDACASSYESEYFTYFAKGLVVEVEIIPEAHILDVATGRGAILRQAANIINSKGELIGIDISSQMIRETQNEFKKFYPNIKLLKMDAENLDFPDQSFDVVFCGFGIFFMPNLKKVLKEFKRVLKNEGVLAVSTWGKRDNVHFIYKEVAANFNLNIKTTAHDFNDAKPVVELLKETGFNDISVKKDSCVQVYPSFEGWWESLWTHGTRDILEQLTDVQLKEFKLILNEELKVFFKFNGLYVNFEAFYTIAHKIVK